MIRQKILTKRNTFFRCTTITTYVATNTYPRVIDICCTMINKILGTYTNY